MSDGQIALLILLATGFAICVVFAVAAAKDPEKFSKAMSEVVQKAKEDWAAKQAEKKKKQEETANTIADVVLKILKK